MPLQLTHDFSTKTGTIVASDFSDNFSDVQAKFNGNITNEDVSANAAIAVSKLAASKQHLMVTLSAKTMASGWPGSDTIVAHAPIPGTVAQGNWTVENVYWACNDTGAGAGVLSVRWGFYDASGSWSNVSTIVTSETINNSAAGNDAEGPDGCTLATTSLGISNSVPRMLALMGTTADGTTLTTEYADLTVTVHLSRTITA